GLGCGPILALPGDRVRYGLSMFEVNGRPQRRLPHMPQEGEWIVPEKHWFLWPNLAIGGNRIASEEALGATLREIGTVPEERYVGKACRRWFWHRQLES
ncbi:MAG TPA: hypothetical protein VNT26_22130, partial [Candidatus Sulfotelmatobacter sp.]|nr:hypothetical protein [Candidatus Sulfotelmatobacter sp.]